MNMMAYSAPADILTALKRADTYGILFLGIDMESFARFWFFGA